MDVIDVLVMQRKQELEIAMRDMKMYEERYNDAKESYINALKLKELRDSSPKDREEVINYMNNQEKEFEAMMLDMASTPEEYIKRLLEKKKKGE